MEWPPRSGGRREFAEVDRAARFPTEIAKQKLVPGQIGLVEELMILVAAPDQPLRSTLGGR